MVQSLHSDAGSVEQLELRQHVGRCYDKVLRRYHGWVTQAAFKVREV